MASLSVVTITQDSEGRIGKVVRNALELGYEHIVVDSGSSDNTIREAEAAGARVVSWNAKRFDYSSPRNLGTKLASGDWVLHLDTDERIDADIFGQRLHDKIDTAQTDRFSVLQQAYRDGQVHLHTRSYQPRLFRKGDVQFRGLVHEWLYPLREQAIAEILLEHIIEDDVTGRRKWEARKKLARRELHHLRSQVFDSEKLSCGEDLVTTMSRCKHIIQLLLENPKGLKEAREALKVAGTLYARRGEHEGVTEYLRLELASCMHSLKMPVPHILDVLDDGPVPDNPDFFYTAATFAYSIPRLALPLVRRGLEIRPNSKLYQLQADLFKETGNMTKETEALDKWEELFPEDPFLKARRQYAPREVPETMAI